MTAVANPPSFGNINRPAWGNGGQSLNGSINHDEVRGMFAPRKSIQRTNSSSSIASNSSTSSSSTLVSSNGSTNGAPAGIGTVTPVNEPNGLPITTLRKRPIQKAQWSANKPVDAQSEFVRGGAGRQPMSAGPNGVGSHQLLPFVIGQNGAPNSNGNNTSNGAMARPAGDSAPPPGQPVLYLISLNGTFDRKTITVPFLPETLRIGRQTNKSTTPTTINGYFDSKVLSRQHAEIWADRQGKVWIRDIKSSNGTFVNGNRLSAENRESDPHELQTNDHLELGIDIVSEDQKSVVHHKVAAKVEHAGYINSATSLLDMNFGDLDPANGAIMGPQMNGMPFRGRTGSQSSIGTAGRMAPVNNANAQANGIALQRGLWFTGPSTEAIVKKIHQEMRNAKQQSQDLLRTQEFLKTLLSKDDIRNEKIEAHDQPRQQPQMVNGNGIPFRPDAKARFTDPPAPPPQQPLPEKPAVPSLKRGSTERPKSGPGSNTSPIRPDVMGQVLQLTDALNTAKREIDSQHSRMRELEDKLQREQEARRTAEEMARRLEEAASTTIGAGQAHQMNGSAKSIGDGADILNETFEITFPDNNSPESPSLANAPRDFGGDEAGKAKFAALDSIRTEMEGMKQQLEDFRKRAEKAEAERDADRETLAEMVKRIRIRGEEDGNMSAAAATAAAMAVAGGKASATQTIPRSFSRGGSKRSNLGSILFGGNAAATDGQGMPAANGIDSTGKNGKAPTKAVSGNNNAELSEDELALARASTITPATVRTKAANPALAAGVPYASMVGVVLLGMGLMAYLNGWQPQPTRLDR